MTSEFLVQFFGTLILSVIISIIVFHALNVESCRHRQANLLNRGLCDSCVHYRDTKALTERIESKVLRSRMVEDPFPVLSELELILEEMIRDILNANRTLNKTVLEIICLEYLGKLTFFHNAANSEQRERLFTKFVAGDSDGHRKAWRYYDGHRTCHVVKVAPQDVGFVLEHSMKNPENKGADTTRHGMEEESVEMLYCQLFLSYTDNDEFKVKPSWTAYDWSYAANRYYPSTDPQRSVRRSYTFAKPSDWILSDECDDAVTTLYYRREEGGAMNAMYGIMNLTVMPPTVPATP